MAHSVFVGYAERDRAVAEKLCERLESRGIVCWCWPRDSIDGRDWPEQNAEAISQAEVVLMVLSAASAESSQCQKEIVYATRLNRHILPLQIDDGEYLGSVGLNLANIHIHQHFDVDSSADLSKVAISVRRILRGEFDQRPLAFRKTRRKRLILGLAVVMVVAAAVAVGFAVRRGPSPGDSTAHLVERLAAAEALHGETANLSSHEAVQELRRRGRAMLVEAQNAERRNDPLAAQEWLRKCREHYENARKTSALAVATDNLRKSVAEKITPLRSDHPRVGKAIRELKESFTNAASLVQQGQFTRASTLFKDVEIRAPAVARDVATVEAADSARMSYEATALPETWSSLAPVTSAREAFTAHGKRARALYADAPEAAKREWDAGIAAAPPLLALNKRALAVEAARASARSPMEGPWAKSLRGKAQALSAQESAVEELLASENRWPEAIEGLQALQESYHDLSREHDRLRREAESDIEGVPAEAALYGRYPSQAASLRTALADAQRAFAKADFVDVPPAMKRAAAARDEILNKAKGVREKVAKTLREMEGVLDQPVWYLSVRAKVEQLEAQLASLRTRLDTDPHGAEAGAANGLSVARGAREQHDRAVKKALERKRAWETARSAAPKQVAVPATARTDAEAAARAHDQGDFDRAVSLYDAAKAALATELQAFELTKNLVKGAVWTGTMDVPRAHPKRAYDVRLTISERAGRTLRGTIRFTQTDGQRSTNGLVHTNRFEATLSEGGLLIQLSAGGSSHADREFRKERFSCTVTGTTIRGSSPIGGHVKTLALRKPE